MELTRKDRVVNVRTGEFAAYETTQEVETADGKKYVLYEVQPERESSQRQVWRAEEIAPWIKPSKLVSTTPTHA